MSQHRFQTTYQGDPVSVLMGWDRPLQGFFLVIAAICRDGYVYSNLEDRALRQCFGLPPALDYFLGKLSEFGIEVPSRMIDEIKADADKDVGNRYVVYDCAGNIKSER
ncbi:MAG TPA: hypothetical protein VFP68_19180 [Burkholderiaceae bacterium]|nr:hypothetical protein [Burkholderiaceae bacterium]